MHEAAANGHTGQNYYDLTCHSLRYTISGGNEFLLDFRFCAMGIAVFKQKQNKCFPSQNNHFTIMLSLLCGSSMLFALFPS